MKDKLDEILRSTAERTFESLAFMLTMPEAHDGAGQAAAAGASVRFSGPLDGELIVRVCESVLQELAANMLGLEGGSEARDEDRIDALKELTNVMCGNLLPEIAGPAAEFKVSAPSRLAEGKPGSRGDREPAARARLRLDAGTAEVVLFAREPARSG